MIRKAKLFRCCAPALFILLLLTLGCGQSSISGRDRLVFDVYEKGIRRAALIIDLGKSPASCSIKKLDIHSRQWSETTSATEDQIDTKEELQLWGALRDLPSEMQELRSIRWNSSGAIGWPDENSIYVRHRRMTERVDGEEVTAYRWALKDGSLPMDLVIDTENDLIAAADPRNDLCLVRRGYENFTTLKLWSDPSISKPESGIRALGKQMIEMSDGIKLATLVYLPEDGTEGPYPVIFMRTPYGIGGLIDAYWHYCARGYGLVFQSCRGTCYWDPEHRSEGTWEFCINEPSDGAEALEWLAQQPWCDGNVSMLGGSYVGYTQWTGSMAGNPVLKSLIPEVSMGTVHSDQPYWGGGFIEGLAYYCFWMLNTPILEDRTWTEILRHRPLIEIDSYATGRDIPQWNTILEHWRLDDYWRKQDWYRGDHPRDFSSFQISGWFDDDFPGTRRNWELMQKKGKGPQKLLIGPWKHGYNVDRKLNGFSFGLDALRDDIWLLKQKWFDRFLKGIENGVEMPPVEYFVLGADEWRDADQWPPKEMESRNLYFHSNGKANVLSSYGQLSPMAPDRQEPSDRYRYNPADPAPNWMSFDRMERWQDVQSFPYDFKDIESRQDVVVYTTEPLEEDLTIVGDVLVALYASCNVRDTDWWAYLSDVYPDGQSVRLTTGMIRARFRNNEDKIHNVFGTNFEKETHLSGNMRDVVRYHIPLRSIAATFKKGHRIRIAVMNACDNFSFPNSNTGENEAYVTRTVVGTMAIHHNRQHPSHVILPVLPQ
jgi:putative CocE/NonD family hydrolase